MNMIGNFCGLRRRALSAGLAVLLALMIMPGCGGRTPEDLLSEANAYYLRNNLVEAQLLYQQILTKHPDSAVAPRARMGLAAIYGAEGKFAHEREQLDFLIALAGGPQTEAGWMPFSGKIHSFMREEKPELALQEAIETSPTFSQAPTEGQFAFQIMLADLYYHNERHDEAQVILEHAARGYEIDPLLELEAYQRLSQIHRLAEHYDESIAVLERFMERYPDHPKHVDLLLRISAIYEQQERPQEAAQTIEVALSKLNEAFDKAVGAEERGQLLMVMGLVERQRKQPEAAEALYRRVIEEYPVGRVAMDARRALVDLALEQHDGEAAVAMFEEIVRMHPGTPEAQEAGQMVQQLRADIESGAFPPAVESGPEPAATPADEATTIGATVADTPTTGTAEVPVVEPVDPPAASDAVSTATEVSAP